MAIFSPPLVGDQFGQYGRIFERTVPDDGTHHAVASSSGDILVEYASHPPISTGILSSRHDSGDGGGVAGRPLKRRRGRTTWSSGSAAFSCQWQAMAIGFVAVDGHLVGTSWRRRTQRPPLKIVQQDESLDGSLRDGTPVSRGS